MPVVERAFPHPHNPTVCVVDRLVDGLPISTRNVAWDHAPWWAERDREVIMRRLT